MASLLTTSTLLRIFLVVGSAGCSGVGEKSECAVFAVPCVVCAPDISRVSVTPYYTDQLASGKADQSYGAYDSFGFKGTRGIIGGSAGRGPSPYSKSKPTFASGVGGTASTAAGGGRPYGQYPGSNSPLPLYEFTMDQDGGITPVPLESNYPFYNTKLHSADRTYTPHSNGPTTALGTNSPGMSGQSSLGANAQTKELGGSYPSSVTPDGNNPDKVGKTTNIGYQTLNGDTNRNLFGVSPIADGSYFDSVTGPHSTSPSDDDDYSSSDGPLKQPTETNSASGSYSYGSQNLPSHPSTSGHDRFNPDGTFNYYPIATDSTYSSGPSKFPSKPSSAGYDDVRLGGTSKHPSGSYSESGLYSSVSPQYPTRTSSSGVKQDGTSKHPSGSYSTSGSYFSGTGQYPTLPSSPGFHNVNEDGASKHQSGSQSTSSSYPSFPGHGDVNQDGTSKIPSGSQSTSSSYPSFPGHGDVNQDGTSKHPSGSYSKIGSYSSDTGPHPTLPSSPGFHNINSGGTSKHPSVPHSTSGSYSHELPQYSFHPSSPGYDQFKSNSSYLDTSSYLGVAPGSPKTVTMGDYTFNVPNSMQSPTASLHHPSYTSSSNHNGNERYKYPSGGVKNNAEFSYSPADSSYGYKKGDLNNPNPGKISYNPRYSTNGYPHSSENYPKLLPSGIAMDGYPGHTDSFPASASFLNRNKGITTPSSRPSVYGSTEYDQKMLPPGIAMDGYPGHTDSFPASASSLNRNPGITTPSSRQNVYGSTEYDQKMLPPGIAMDGYPGHTDSSPASASSLNRNPGITTPSSRQNVYGSTEYDQKMLPPGIAMDGYPGHTDSSPASGSSLNRNLGMTTPSAYGSTAHDPKTGLPLYPTSEGSYTGASSKAHKSKYGTGQSQRGGKSNYDYLIPVGADGTHPPPLYINPRYLDSYCGCTKPHDKPKVGIDFGAGKTSSGLDLDFTANKGATSVVGSSRPVNGMMGAADGEVGSGKGTVDYDDRFGGDSTAGKYGAAYGLDGVGGHATGSYGSFDQSNGFHTSYSDNGYSFKSGLKNKQACDHGYDTNGGASQSDGGGDGLEYGDAVVDEGAYKSTEFGSEPGSSYASYATTGGRLAAGDKLGDNTGARGIGFERDGKDSSFSGYADGEKGNAGTDYASDLTFGGRDMGNASGLKNNDYSASLNAAGSYSAGSGERGGFAVGGSTYGFPAPPPPPPPYGLPPPVSKRVAKADVEKKEEKLKDLAELDVMEDADVDQHYAEGGEYDAAADEHN